MIKYYIEDEGGAKADEVKLRLLETWRANAADYLAVYSDDPKEVSLVLARYNGLGETNEHSPRGDRVLDVAEFLENSDMTAVDNAARELGVEYEDLRLEMLKEL